MHHRAVDLAKRRHDVVFFWRLLEFIPEAEAVSGSAAEADIDIENSSGWLHDFAHREGKLDQALRAVYLDYLQHHDDRGRHGRRL